MKTLSKIAVLLPLVAAACTGATHSDFRAAAAREVECSISIDARSSALEVQRTVNAVLNGELDACNGAVADLKSMSASLARIEADSATDPREIRLAFHYFMNPDFKPLNTP
jgi:hypothetical protein